MSSHPSAYLGSVDLMAGPIDYSVFEDTLHITFGESGSRFLLYVTLTEETIVTLTEVFQQTLPVMRNNAALITSGRLKDLPPRTHHTAIIGQPLRPIEPTRERSAERPAADQGSSLHQWTPQE